MLESTAWSCMTGPQCTQHGQWIAGAAVILTGLRVISNDATARAGLLGSVVINSLYV
jgi:hypothetical protein